MSSFENGCHSRAAAGQAEHHFHVLRVVALDGVDEASVAIWCSIPLLVDLAHNLVDEIVAALICLFYHVAQVLGLWSRHARQAGAPYCGARAQFHLLHHPSRTELPRWRSYSDEARAMCVVCSRGCTQAQVLETLPKQWLVPRARLHVQLGFLHLLLSKNTYLTRYPPPGNTRDITCQCGRPQAPRLVNRV